MCNVECENGPTHSQYECKTFQKAGYRGPNFKTVDEYRELQFNPYCFITTLRTLLLKGKVRFHFLRYALVTVKHLDVSVEDWEDIQELRDHNPERKAFDEEAWEEHEVPVSKFMIETLKLGVTEEEIFRVIGLLSTNNANFSLGEGFGKGAGLYVTYSRVNHGCWCNTKTLKYKDNRLELRAAEPIKKGDEIVNQYVKPNIGTVSRRLILKNKWHFECDCVRCADPTEFGSMMSAILCPDCGDIVLPTKPLVSNEPWKCKGCGKDVDVDQVSEALMKADAALKESNDEEDIVQHYERYLPQYEHDFQTFICSTFFYKAPKGLLLQRLTKQTVYCK